ncbi:MAG TPA: hypothetical protein PKD85_07490, partial [Saprospiraceae bacterium]|nr:hypothetical protein [Saprospiraceae bacterium]
QGEWYKVKDYEKEGYVFSGFLLDFEPPTGTPSVGFENYLSKYFKESEPKQAYSVKYKDGTSEKVVTPIPLEKVQVNEEMDWFEIIEKYEGGRTYTEVIGYESSTKKIFIPNISMREGFLLMKGILPYFLIAEDQCGLELKKVPFSKKNYTIKIDESCIFNIEIGKVGNEVTSITISNDDYYYSGLSVIKVNGGLEISRFYAL